MRILPEPMQALIDSAGPFVGDDARPHGRVTVQPDWQLHYAYGEDTDDISKLPFRYFQHLDDDQVEVEVPNLKSINWDRTIDADAGTCEIVLYNQWHYANGEAPIPDILGDPGYFSFDHGSDGPDLLYGQDLNDWADILIPNALLRTFEGFGGFVDGIPMSIEDAIAGGFLLRTGTWLVDEVTVGTDGMLTLSCRDMGKLLIEQQIYRPLMPAAWSPLHYRRWDWNDAIAHGAPVYDSTAPIESGPGAEGPKYVTDITFHPDGTGYWIVGTDGGVFSFHVPFHGSRGADEDTAPMMSIAADPLGQGYWLASKTGGVFTFGDLDFWGEAAPTATPVVAIAAAVDGAGYYLCTDDGTIHEFGSAVHYGDVPGGDPVVDMAVTPTGLGYWLLATDGVITAYGDAVDYGNGADRGSDLAVALGHTAAVAGLWVVHSSGRTDVVGDARTFHVSGTTTPLNTTGDVASPPTGRLTVGNVTLTGRPVVHQADGTTETLGPIIVASGANFALIPTISPDGVQWSDAEAEQVFVDDGTHLGIFDTEGNATLYAADLLVAQDEHYGGWPATLNDPIFSITVSPTGNGYLLGGGDGGIFSFGDAPFWGSLPADYTYQVRSNGNYDDWASIVIDLLLWSGFLLKDDDASGQVFGRIETTGAYSNDPLPADMFDKKPVIDPINQLRETVGYSAWVDEYGAYCWRSPNLYFYGCVLEDDSRTEDIPVLDSRVIVTDYSTGFNDRNIRSRITIASASPDADLAETVQTTRIINSDLLRGMVRPALWLNEHLTKKAEQERMLDRIIDLVHYSLRTGNVTIKANPGIQVDDQVRVFERYSASTMAHYVRGISSNHDLDAGKWDMTLNTSPLPGVERGPVTWAVNATADLTLA